MNLIFLLRGRFTDREIRAISQINVPQLAQFPCIL